MNRPRVLTIAVLALAACSSSSADPATTITGPNGKQVEVCNTLGSAWAGLFGLAFLLVFLTHFTALLDEPILLAWTVLQAVGCVACVKLARQADERSRSGVR